MPPMDETQRSKYLTRHVLMMSFLGSLYVVMGSFSFLGFEQVLGVINIFPDLSRLFEAMPKDLMKLWNFLSGSFLLSIAAMFYFSAIHPPTLGYRALIIFSTLVSGLGAIYLFENHGHYFAYLCAGIFQLAVAALVSWCLLVAVVKRPFSKSKEAPKQLPKQPPITIRTPPLPQKT